MHRWLVGFVAVLWALWGCDRSREVESLGTVGQAISMDDSATLGFENPADWQATGATLGASAHHVEGSGSLAVSQLSYAVLTSRKLSSLNGVVGSLVGFDLSIPAVQPNESWFGQVQLFVDLPSQGLFNAPVGQRELSFLPRDSFRRIEFALSAEMQAKLAASYQNDLQFKIVLNVSLGPGTYYLDRLSFQHYSSEPIDNSGNAAILGFERADAWVPSVGTAQLTSTRVEGAKAMVVVPSGWTVLTSARLATPSVIDPMVGFDLMIPASQPNPWWYGETQLYVDLPSQGVFNASVGRYDLISFQPGSFARVSYTLPTWLLEKLGAEYDDLRFKIVLNTPPGAGAHVLDRFAFGPVTTARQVAEFSFDLPQNIAPDRLALFADHGLRIGSGVRLKSPGAFQSVIGNSSGATTIEDGAIVDSVFVNGALQVNGTAQVRGFVVGASSLADGSASRIFGQIDARAVPRQAVSWSVRFEPATTDVLVSSGQQRVLNPGRYRLVRVQNGGSLGFQAGTFHIDSLVVDPGAKVVVGNVLARVIVNVRSIISLAGSFDNVSRPLRPANVILTYAGLDRVTLKDLPLFFVTEEAPVVLEPCALGACRLGGLWAGAIEVLGPGRQIDLDQYSPPFGLTSEDPVVGIVGMPDRVHRGTHPTDPVIVDSDNPSFTGDFSWQPGGESGTGTAPYFVNGRWTGITNAFVHFTPQDPFKPGLRVDSPLLPQGDQSSNTTSFASWETRSFDLFHGAVFRVNRSLTHTSGSELAEGQSLYVKLADDVLLVPIVVIGWDDEDQARRLKALFDFLPYGRDGNVDQPYTDPVVQGYEPPDNIWAQCRIQFQAIHALWLGEPPAHAPENACDNFDETKRDYVTDDELHARLRAALPFDYDDLYGPSGIQPITMQFGQIRGKLGGACDYGAKADVAGKMIQDNSWEYASQPAHELGHILFSQEGHSGTPNLDLMADPQGAYLDPAKCSVPQSAARLYSDRYRRYKERIGHAEPPPRDPPHEFPFVPPIEVVRGEFATTCCRIDGINQRVPTLACSLLDGDVVTTGCTVCCATDYSFKDEAECPADAALIDDKCVDMCCDWPAPVGDDVPKHHEVLKEGQCDANHGVLSENTCGIVPR